MPLLPSCTYGAAVSRRISAPAPKWGFLFSLRCVCVSPDRVMLKKRWKKKGGFEAGLKVRFSAFGGTDVRNEMK